MEGTQKHLMTVSDKVSSSSQKLVGHVCKENGGPQETPQLAEATQCQTLSQILGIPTRYFHIKSETHQAPAL